MSQHNTLPEMFTIEFSTEGIELNAYDIQGKKLDIDFREENNGAAYAMLSRWVEMQRNRDEEE